MNGNDMRSMILAMLVAALGLGGCGGDGDAADDGGSSGDDGGSSGDGGGSDSGVGDSGPGDGTEGSPCTLTAECMEGLYCSEARVCEPAGDLGEGELCETTADCQRGLVCVVRSGARMCRSAGSGGEGATCITAEECQAGLFCVDGTCSATPPGGTDAGAGDASLLDGGGKVCDPGDPCDDGSACTSDQCIANRCQNTLLDTDLDGYADEQLGSECQDCKDDDPDVNPDHEAFESEQHEGNLITGPSWDWNCDGVAEKRWTHTVDCSEDGLCDDEGWLGEVPECGQTGAWVRCTGSGVGCTTEEIEPSRQQTCR